MNDDKNIQYSENSSSAISSNVRKRNIISNLNILEMFRKAIYFKSTKLLFRQHDTPKLLFFSIQAYSIYLIDYIYHKRNSLMQFNFSLTLFVV